MYNQFNLTLPVVSGKIYLHNLTTNFKTELFNELSYEDEVFCPTTRKMVIKKGTMLSKNGETCSYGFADVVVELGKLHDINITYDMASVKHLDLSNVSTPYKLTPWQRQFIKVVAKNANLTTTSPTGSGKSVLIFMLVIGYLSQCKGGMLITTDTNTLIKQIKSDFIKWGVDKNLIGEFHGTKKEFDKRIVIATWQSIHSGYSNKNKTPEQKNAFIDWLNEFDMFIADECHLYKSKEIYAMGDKMSHCRFKYGFTGTLDGSQEHTMIMRGLFGKKHRLTTLNEMRSVNFIPTLKVSPILLKWNDVRKKQGRLDYQKERSLIQNSKTRMLLIARIIKAIETEYNIIIFTNFNNQVSLLSKYCKQIIKDKNIITINGESKANKDKNIAILSQEKRVIAIANYKMIQTGINASNISVGVSIDAGKSKIKVKQSIGRLLRKHDDIKESKRVIDIYDDINGRAGCASTKHFNNRLQYYIEDGHIVDDIKTLLCGEL